MSLFDQPVVLFAVLFLVLIAIGKIGIRWRLIRAKLTQDRLAGLLGVSRRTINEIVTEKRSSSADMAHRLARLFNTTPELWLGLQQDVDLWKAVSTGEEDYRKIRPLRSKVASHGKPHCTV